MFFRVLIFYFNNTLKSDEYFFEKIVRLNFFFFSDRNQSKDNILVLQ